MTIQDRIKHAWDAFRANRTTRSYDYGFSSSRPAHKSVRPFNASSYVSSIYNRIALDVSMTKFKHVKINPENEDETDVLSGLNYCLTTEANIDQSHLQFIHDLVYSMMDEGVVAVVPVDTTVSPKVSGGYDIKSLRVGKIMTWFPKHVEIDLYNDNTGQNERIYMEKKNVAIIENPLYSVVNDENPTLKRLIRKLNELDDVDALAASGRLDLIVGLPYAIKTDRQREMAEERIKDIEAQLSMGRHGVIYTDATEKATQLNRPINSQLPESIDKLTQQFYNQLGLTQNIFNGTADEGELRTYNARAIDPIAEHIVAEFNRKFLTKTARTQGQTIIYYRDMFKFVPVETIANLGDSLRRNSIASSNEMRRILRLKTSNDPRADELFNPNIADKNQNGGVGTPGPKSDEEIEMDKINKKLKQQEKLNKKSGSLTPPDDKSK